MRCIDASTYKPQRPGASIDIAEPGDENQPAGTLISRPVLATHPRLSVARLGKADAEYVATQTQSLADTRIRRPTAANGAHPDTGQSQEESDHAEPQ